MKRSRINASRPLPKRKNRTTPGEPTRRARRNRANGIAAENAFKRTHPGAVRVGPGGRADYKWRGHTYEVKYGTARPLAKQSGAHRVQYARKGGRMVRISVRESLNIKNRAAKVNNKRARRRGPRR